MNISTPDAMSEAEAPVSEDIFGAIAGPLSDAVLLRLTGCFGLFQIGYREKNTLRDLHGRLAFACAPVERDEDGDPLSSGAFRLVRVSYAFDMHSRIPLRLVWLATAQNDVLTIVRPALTPAEGYGPDTPRLFPVSFEVYKRLFAAGTRSAGKASAKPPRGRTRRRLLAVVPQESDEA